MIHHMIMTADEAIEKLKSGNMRYLLMNSNSGNVSAALRKFTYEHGQHPHAIIVTCSDSRVIPETIFSAGLGELQSHQPLQDKIPDPCCHTPDIPPND